MAQAKLASEAVEDGMAFLFRRELPLQESSTNVEVENLRSFLERIASHISSGFGQPEINCLMAMANTIAVDDEDEKEFSIICHGRRSRFRIRLFMDDIGEAGVYIFSPPGLAAKIDAEIEKIMDQEPD